MNMVARGGGRGGLAVLDDDAARPCGGCDEHEPAAADVAGRGIRDGQRERRGHRGIDGVAALLQDRQAGLGSRAPTR